MVESIGNLLPKDRFQEPPEVVTIQNFVQEKYNYTPKVTIQERQIIIEVNSAALAGSLRMHFRELHKKLDTNKRLVIRIG